MPLVTRQADTGRLIVQTTEPVSPADGELWNDIGQNPPILKSSDNGTFRPVMQSGILVQGDINIANAANELGRLALGTAGQVLLVNAGATDLEYGSQSESAEQSSTPITVDATQAVADRQYHVLFTLPTTESWYIITGIEWTNGDTVAGNVMCGVRLVDAEPPVLDASSQVAFGAELAAAGTDGVQRNSQISSMVIRGGTLLAAWTISNNAAQKFGSVSPASNVNRLKSITYTAVTPVTDNDAWTVDNQENYIKVYFRGIL